MIHRKSLCRPAAFLLSLLLLLSGCTGPIEIDGLGNGMQPEHSMALSYAHEFSVDYYEGGYKLLSLANGDRYLVVPQGQPLPEGIDGKIIPLYQPIGDIYLAATSAVGSFDTLDALSCIRFSGTKTDGWYNEAIRHAMEQGQIRYAGKYSEPDYELLMAEGCRLAIQSTMIDHAPEVLNKLDELGIPVLIDRSSGETHPLGRAEWIKLYAALVDREQEAAEWFDAQAAALEQTLADADTGKSVAFFYINSSGNAVVRRENDYITRMLEMAGGHSVFAGLDDTANDTATITLNTEAFYAAAKEADIILYNSTMIEELHSLDELLEKCPLLRDCRAVKDGNVWCTRRNMFQETARMAQMIEEFHAVLSDQADTAVPEFLFRLQ